MARIAEFAVTEEGASTVTSLVCNMPSHVAGDVLLYMASKDGAVAITATAGWTAIQDGLTAGCAYRCMWKLAAGTDTETLTVATGTAENFTVVVLCIRDANTTTPVDVSAESGADATVMPFAGPSTTSTVNDCLVVHGWFSDSGIAPTAYAPLVNVYSGDNAANSVGVAYTVKKTAGAITAASWYGHTNDDGRGVVIAIRDAGAGVLPAYSDSGVSSGQVLRPFAGTSTTFSDSWPVTLTNALLGGDWVSVQRDVGGSFTDFTGACNNTTAADVTFPTVVGNAMYFGANQAFQTVCLNLSTAGVAGVVAWEYWNGSAWSSTGVTGSNMLAAGVSRSSLNPTAVKTMQQTTVNGTTLYWLRARVTTLYSTAPVATQGRVDGRGTSYIAGGSSPDNGTNSYMNAASNAGSTTTTVCAGFQWNFGAALNLSSGVIYGTYRGSLARDLALDCSFPLPVAGPGGLQVTLYDASNNHLSYIVHARDAESTDVDGRNVFAIDWNGAAVSWAARGAVSKSAVTYSMWTSLGQSGAVSLSWSMLCLATRIGVAGGSAGSPIDFDAVRYVSNNCIGAFPFIQAAGAAYTTYIPLQFGGGDKVCLAVDKKTIQFPATYDGVGQFAWNAAVNVAGVKFYPKSGDVFRFTDCLFTGPSAYRWEWDAAMASSGWTIDLNGTTVVGATVTLRAAVPISSMSFIVCPTFTQNGATITGTAFTDTKITSSTLADVALMSGSSLTKTTGTAHGIEVSGAAATITLTGVTFTGYAGSNGSTGNEAIYVNIASGTVTINIAGGGSTPSIRTAGATVVVQNAVTVKVTARDADTSAEVQSARVLLYAATGATVTVTRSGSTATVAHTAHGRVTGDKVVISGAVEGEYNGVKVITVVDANSYTYTISGAPGTPATGTINSYRTILDGDTDAGGIVQDTGFNFSGTLAVTGRVRKGTSATYYKTSPLSGSITSAGLDLTSFLVKDV